MAEYTEQLEAMQGSMMGMEESATLVKDSLDTIWLNGSNAIDEFASGNLAFLFAYPYQEAEIIAKQLGLDYETSTSINR